MAWTGVVLYLGYHPSVISRSLEGRTDKTWFFIYSKPIWGESEFYKWLLSTISPRIARDLYAISALGGDYHLGIPLITPLSQSSSESTKLLKFSSVEHQLQHSWITQHMDTKLGMRDGMGLCCALLGYHPKVTSRSSQGHCKVKLKKQDFWGLYLFQAHLGCRWLLQMNAATHFLSGTISPRITSMQFHPWGVITALVFPLSHPFPKVDQHKY